MISWGSVSEVSKLSKNSAYFQNESADILQDYQHCENKGFKQIN